MIKAVIATVSVLGAIAVGLVGMYFAMPTLAPEVVEKAVAELDSLARLDSLAQVLTMDLEPGGTELPAAIDSLIASSPDSLGRAMMPESTAEGNANPPMDAADGAVAAGGKMALQDSLDALQRRVAALSRERLYLLDEIKALQAQQKEQQALQGSVQELSTTLTKLEDKELASVLAQLDVSVLEALYKQASARNRTRLLQAMPPPVAADFIRRLVQPGGAVARPPVAPDTLSNAGVAGHEAGL